MKRTVVSLLVASLVVLAGCAGGITGQSGTQTQSADSGTVQFYVSDEANAISQFEHLNVTVTKVGLAQSGDADVNASGEWDVESESEDGLQLSVDGNVSDGENATVTLTYDGDAVANTTVDVSTGETETTVMTDDNGTATVQMPAGAEEFTLEAETGADSQYGESEAQLEFEYETEAEGDNEWVERDVDSRTVDLTELQGANATLLGNMSVPAGEYEKVFVHVDEVNGTLQSGKQVNVKLPSEKLHLNEDFTVDAEGDIEFVFDITVFEAGNSGKYILKPVASESGTDVPIESVDEDEESELEAEFVGDVNAGKNATVKVTQEGEPVANATIELAGDATVTTDENGTAVVEIPEGAEEFELEASTSEDSEYGESEAELEFEAEESDDSENDEQDSEDSDEPTEKETEASVDLAVSLDGTFAANEQVVVFATDGDGEPVEGAEVHVDGELVGETSEDGQLTFTLPEDVDVDSQVTVDADGESVVVDSSTVAAAQ